MVKWRHFARIAIGVLAVFSSQAHSQTAPSTLSAIAQAAQQRGTARCLDRIDALAKNLGEKYDIGVFIFNDLANPDSRVLSLSLELSPSPSGGSAYMSATFAPNALNGCDIMVESAIYWSSKCSAVGLAYPGYIASGKLLANIEIRENAGPARLFLVPSGAGCLSIEKSVYY